eukprot:scaffold273_cov242-Pinguiococcus_pyrenoidosus.AAC.46
MGALQASADDEPAAASSSPRDVRGLRNLGSASVNMAWVASGVIDAYYEDGYGGSTSHESAKDPGRGRPHTLRV